MPKFNTNISYHNIKIAVPGNSLKLLKLFAVSVLNTNQTLNLPRPHQLFFTVWCQGSLP